MIQRKQTIFLLLAVIASVVCLSMPIGRIEPVELGGDAYTFYNLFIKGSETVIYKPLLFSMLLIEATVAFIDIFLYKKRVLQARLCTLCMGLIVVWYGIYALIATSAMTDITSFHAEFSACLPLVAVILLIMARRGIMADEKLVRAADRIR